MADSDATGNIIESRFKAFVSYSHADKAAAQKLHRKLETYRLPKHLRQLEGSTTDEKPVDGRIGPIFRDREDLPAAEDLSESVKKALTVSEALIVLCSPDAQKSPWVAREIELFRELHPDRPVLAAILRGEPQDAFPEPLKQGREPLAADLRKEGDGPRLGFMKVVAGIAGVPLDALINRDAQRRVRRVTAITVAAVAAMVVMALMTTFALQARNEAQAQRAEAEGLVDFMLTELRDDLRKVGSVDTMLGVSERALKYFQSQGDLSELDAENLLRRAAALHALGEDVSIHVEGGSVQALALFEEAFRTTASLTERDPDNGEYVFAHGQSAFWVGRAHYSLNNWPEVEKYWSIYRKVAARLYQIDPQREEWKLEQGYAIGGMCTLALHREDKEVKDMSACEDAMKTVEDSAAFNPDDPDLQSALANRLGWLADAQIEQGQPERALASYTRQHDVVAALHEADPDNASHTDQLMRAKMTLSEALASQEMLAEAQSYKAAAERMAKEMVERDPNNQRWQLWLERIRTGTK